MISKCGHIDAPEGTKCPLCGDGPKSRLDEIRERFAISPNCTCDSHYMLQRLEEAEKALKEIMECAENAVDEYADTRTADVAALSMSLDEARAYFDKWK